MNESATYKQLRDYCNLYKTALLLPKHEFETPSCNILLVPQVTKYTPQRSAEITSIETCKEIAMPIGTLCWIEFMASEPQKVKASVARRNTN